MQDRIESDASAAAGVSAAPAGTTAGPETNQTKTGWRLVGRWIVAGNPFYPLSAVLVLFGIFLLSGEERLFGAELIQLWFNFGAVEGYGLLIVVTSLFLVRRGIYYDTLMLVVLGTLPILVPFILISQAAFLGGGLMAAACCVAAVLGVTQYLVLRCGIGELPLRGRLAFFFAVIIAVNVMLPIVIKQLHTHADAIRWAVKMEQYGHLAWNLVLPVLALAGFVVRMVPGQRFGPCAVGWLPLTWMTLLVAGTAAHAASLGYVYSFPWKLAYLYPLIWVGAWLVWWRRWEWAPAGAAKMCEHSVLLPAFVALAAWLDAQSTALCWLNLLNLAAFVWFQLRQPANRTVSVLLAASLLGWLRTLPVEAVAFVPSGSTRTDLILLVLSFGTVALGSWRRTPAWGVLVALAVIHPLQFFGLTSPHDWLLVGQLALVAWWLHSLRWDLSESFARWLRRIGFGLWWAHSVLWFLRNGGEGWIDLTTIAMVVAASAALTAWLRARPSDWGYAGLALMAGSLGGLPQLIDQARRVPTGLWILLGGGLCFVFGTLLALWRRRCEVRPRTTPD